MLGALIGDISGSRFEWDRIKVKEFEFLKKDGCFATDDSIMTIAISKAILDCNGDYTKLGENTIREMKYFGRKYPDAGYGGRFRWWLKTDNSEPYNSFGNGSAMRVSPVAYVANSLDEAINLSKIVTEVTHNHPEGIKGAEATTVAIYMALQGMDKLEIKDYIDRNYYPMDFTLDEIRPSYRFNETCQETVPQALEAFFESTDFEDSIRNAVSLGGDSDTLAAITGSIAEAYYGIPSDIREKSFTFLDKELIEVVNDFEEKSGNRS